MSTATPTRNSDQADFRFAFNPVAAVKEVAKNWGWLLAAGVVSVLAGTFCLMAPMVATAAVGIFLAVILLLVGSVNLAGVCFAEKGMKLESFVVGAVQLLLAGMIVYYPLASVMSLTIFIAVLLMFEGVSRLVLAFTARGVPGWGWMLAGGLATVATSVIIITALPTAAFWVIGILVGANLICQGAVRIAVALEARKIANAAD